LKCDSSVTGRLSSAAILVLRNKSGKLHDKTSAFGFTIDFMCPHFFSFLHPKFFGFWLLALGFRLAFQLCSKIDHLDVSAA